MKQYGLILRLVALVSSLASGNLRAEEIIPRSTLKAGGYILAVAFSPDGSALAASIGRPDLGWVVGKMALGSTVERFPGEIKIWDVSTEKEKLTIGGNPPTSGLCYSPDGKTFVSCGQML